MFLVLRFISCNIQVANNSVKYYIQSWAIRWALGCVNSHPAARGSQEVGFTQPRAHLIAHRCTYLHLLLLSSFPPPENGSTKNYSAQCGITIYDKKGTGIDHQY